MKASRKMREWLADRVSFVQYPNVRAADDATRSASRTGWRFAHPMPIGKRIDMLIMSIGLLFIGMIAAALVGVFIYCLL